jgi:mono/diheme cytochrome c family protein
MKYLFVLLFLTGCRETKVKYYYDEALLERGRDIYRMSCMHCHGVDPGLGTMQAPAISGSSYELLQEKVIHGAYPDGYIPKRTTRNMPKFPSLQSELKGLERFLNTL